VAVGGTSVGVSVGGTAVALGAAVSVGGGCVGKAVGEIVVAVVVQPTKKILNTVNINNLMEIIGLLIILSSCYLSTLIIG
jgi:hypothetical protein